MMQLNRNQQFLEECSICCLVKGRTNSIQDKMRPLEICYECWYNHISNVVLRLSYRVGDKVLSPFNAGEPIDIITCINSLKDEHCKEIEQTLFMKYNSFTQDIEKCPAENCDYVYIGQKCEWRGKDNVYNCPKCDMPLTLNTNYSITKIFTAFYLLLSNKCPKCSIPIQKIKGCPHMTCPCGHHFCWYCYKDHPSGSSVPQVYNLHTIPQCSFIFLSKIVLFILGMLSIVIASQGRGFVDKIASIFGTLFSIVWRSVMLDGLILIQVMVFMMVLKKRRNYFRFYGRGGQTKIIIIGIIVNILILALLYLLDELMTSIFILMGEVIIGVTLFIIGYSIVYSVETWFEFIA